MKTLAAVLASGTSLFTTLPLLADGEAAPAGNAQGGSLMQTLIMIAVALVFFYFILWRPEQRRRKQMDKLRGSLKKGDRVTAMGIIGTVVKVQETTVILSLYDNAKVEILKAAITDVQPAAEEKADKAVEASETR